MKTKVLLVDDDVSVLGALSDLLQAEGYDVIDAFGGENAIERFEAAGGADLVLLDLNMPFWGGWKTFDRLTAINPLLPIIIITARPHPHPLAITADALLEKPLEIPLLLATMRRILDQPSEVRVAARAPRLHGQPHAV
jgi:DNA-binding response OmpR family regulator